MTRVHLQGYVFGYGKKEELCSLLSVPIMVRDKAVGVINSYPSVPHVFTGEEVELLQAIAIEHTTLIEKPHEMQEVLAVPNFMEREKVPDALEEIDRRRSLQTHSAAEHGFLEVDGRISRGRILSRRTRPIGGEPSRVTEEEWSLYRC